MSAEDESDILQAAVTTTEISLTHPTDLPFAVVKEAMIRLRDHLNDRLERELKCPFSPQKTKP